MFSYMYLNCIYQKKKKINRMNSFGPPHVSFRKWTFGRVNGTQGLGERCSWALPIWFRPSGYHLGTFLCG